MSKELSKVLEGWEKYAFSTNLEKRNADLCQAIKEITQAAANKAAEEGELPALPEFFALGKTRINGRELGHFSDRQMREYARSAIAADRAARPVANKAEVEPVAWMVEDESDGTRLYVSCIKRAADDWLQYDLNRKIIPLYATPPATTGASTAQANGYLNVIENLESQLAECMKVTEKWASAAGEADGRAFKAEEEVLSLHRQLAAGKLRADQGWERAEAKSRECLDLRERMAGSVGASTVLTDERKPIGYARFRAAQRITTEGDVDANEWYEFCEAHEVGDDKLPAFPVYDHPAREVAAQAGQVAVPVARLTIIDGLPDRDRMFIDGAALGNGTHELYAAPSPAKESK